MRQMRPAHEAGQIARTREDLFRRAAEQHHHVGGIHAGSGAERDLDLAWPELHLHRAQRQAKRLQMVAQRLQQRVERVVAVLGQILIAVVQRRDLRRRAGHRDVVRIGERPLALQQMEFDFQAGAPGEASLREHVPACGASWRAWKTGAGCRRCGRDRTESSRCAAPRAARGTRHGSATMTMSPAPSLGGPPPGAKIGNAVRPDRSFSTMVSGAGDAGAQRATASAATSVLPRTTPCASAKAKRTTPSFVDALAMTPCAACCLRLASTGRGARRNRSRGFHCGRGKPGGGATPRRFLRLPVAFPGRVAGPTASIVAGPRTVSAPHVSGGSRPSATSSMARKNRRRAAMMMRSE